jgi:hypothetical protein
MSTLVIVTGPQGSGNHLFAKLLSLHPDVFGWKSLLENEWEGHDKEPFAKIWDDPIQVNTIDWSHKYMVTSISCPYFNNGVETIPQYKKVFERLGYKDLSIKLVIIGRDPTILKYQEERVRGKQTYQMFLDQMPELMKLNPIFVSPELVHLYRRDYLVYLQNMLKIPVASEDPLIDEILLNDENAKYVKPVEEFYRDELARATSQQWK